MKANWKWAMMFAAALALVACDENNKPTPEPEPEPEPEPQPTALISIEDNSIADWDALPANYVASCVCPEAAGMDGLKSAKVFSDELYIYILVEPNDEVIEDKDWTPFHVYLNADNSDLTGGYGDEFTDANAEWLCESAIYSGGAPYSYNPAVFKWWGEVGASGWEWTDPSVEHSGDDGWGAIIPEGTLPVGASQFVDGKFEIRLLKEIISTEFADEFGIGFDIQQNWSSVGFLPCAAVSEDNPSGLAPKLKVKVYKQ